MLKGKDQMDALKQEQLERFKNQEQPPSQGVEGFGPPDFSDPIYNKKQLEDDYENMDSQEYEPRMEEEVPDDDEQDDGNDEGDYDDGDNRFDEPIFQRPQEEVETVSLRQEGGAFLRDEVIFDNGPLRTEVASWKKQFEMDGHTINLSEVGDEVFIWRTMSRTEYKEIMALPNTDPLQREEIICEICMLFPYDYQFDTIANRKAGVPAIIAQEIMHESGFKKIAPPIRL